MSDAYGETYCRKCNRKIFSEEDRWLDFSPSVEDGPDGDDIIVNVDAVATCIDCKPPPPEET